MSWDDEADSLDMQRMKNGVFLQMWVSNKTRDEMMPGMTLGFALAIFGVVAYAFFK